MGEPWRFTVSLDHPQEVFVREFAAAKGISPEQVLIRAVTLLQTAAAAMRQAPWGR